MTTDTTDEQDRMIHLLDLWLGDGTLTTAGARRTYGEAVSKIIAEGFGDVRALTIERDGYARDYAKYDGVIAQQNAEIEVLRVQVAGIELKRWTTMTERNLAQRQVAAARDYAAALPDTWFETELLAVIERAGQKEPR